VIQINKCQIDRVWNDDQTKKEKKVTVKITFNFGIQKPKDI